MNPLLKAIIVIVGICIALSIVLTITRTHPQHTYLLSWVGTLENGYPIYGHQIVTGSQFSTHDVLWVSTNMQHALNLQNPATIMNVVKLDE